MSNLQIAVKFKFFACRGWEEENKTFIFQKIKKIRKKTNFFRCFSSQGRRDNRDYRVKKKRFEKEENLWWS